MRRSMQVGGFVARLMGGGFLWMFVGEVGSYFRKSQIMWIS